MSCHIKLIPKRITKGNQCVCMCMCIFLFEFAVCLFHELYVLTVVGLSWLVSGNGLSWGQVQFPHPGHHSLGFLCVASDHLWVHILVNTVQLPVMDHLCKHAQTQRLTHMGTDTQRASWTLHMRLRCISHPDFRFRSHVVLSSKTTSVIIKKTSVVRGQNNLVPSMRMLRSVRFVLSCSARVKVSDVSLSSLFPKVITTLSWKPPQKIISDLWQHQSVAKVTATEYTVTPSVF